MVGNPADGQIVGLGAAAGEEDLIGVAAGHQANLVDRLTDQQVEAVQQGDSGFVGGPIEW